MSRRVLHIHIGLNKTGTTYLQACLEANRMKLRSCGFELAPLVDGKGAHHPLYRLLVSEGPERLRDVLKQAASPSEMIISCETLCTYLMDPERAKKLRESLIHDFDLRLYIWLRRQDRWAESLTAEAAKRRPGTDVRRHDPILFDFRNRIEVLTGCFGEEAVTVRVYRDDRRTDVFKDFLALVGVPAEGMRTARPQNESLSRRATLLLAQLPPLERKSFGIVLDVLRTTKSIHDDGQRFLLSPEERLAALEPHLESNRRLAKAHDPESEDWFASLPPDEPHWSAPAPITAGEYLAAWLNCMLRCPSWKGGAFGLGTAARISSGFLTAAMAGNIRQAPRSGGSG